MTALERRRYLVPFDPRRALHRFVDILILGGGLTGLRAALAVDPRLQVLVVTKDRLAESNSSYAQGGVASVIDPEDRIEWHVRDTLIAGADLCDPVAVEMVVQQGPECIRELIAWGTQFDLRQDQLALGREGGHSHNRIVHALGDATGQEIMRAVIERARRAEHIEILESAFTLDLLSEGNRCRGATVMHRDQLQLVWAKQTILATGGAGQLYRETTNPAVATADGQAMAIRAGVEVRDLEFMQFHPTVLYIAGGSRSLITEAVRGEGAYLVDRDGLRFMPEYDERAELAPRDIVSQAIVGQMERTHHPCVYLDLSHLDADVVRRRFPGILQACAKFGLDITRDRIPVRPGAHYMIGGVTVDLHGRTSMEGLWAGGEVTSSGLHGANRLASNSLLEGLVYGERAGTAASAAALEMADTAGPARVDMPQGLGLAAEPAFDFNDIRNSLKSLMWRAAGVKRQAAALREALEAVRQWQSYLDRQPLIDAAGWELQNMLDVGVVLIEGALRREESRGVHLREDFPQPLPHWRRHLVFRLGQWELGPLITDAHPKQPAGSQAH